MIASLDDAWEWYQSVRHLARLSQALGEKHWDGLPWDGPLGRDRRLREISADAVTGWAAVTLAELDDLAVLLLFSVFEAAVRTRALDDVRAEAAGLRHPALQWAAAGLADALAHGSFARVTDAYKGSDPDLAELVNQVRRYRNWVAHGRRGDPHNVIDPEAAYDRLRRFLDHIGNAPLPADGVPGD